MELSGMKSFNSIVIIQRKTMIEPEEMKIKQIRRESSPTRPNKSFEITLTEKSNWNYHEITVRRACQGISLQHKLPALQFRRFQYQSSNQRSAGTFPKGFPDGEILLEIPWDGRLVPGNLPYRTVRTRLFRAFRGFPDLFVHQKDLSGTCPPIPGTCLKNFQKIKNLILNGKWSETRWEISSFVYHHYVVEKLCFTILIFLLGWFS